jgi:hypothetical protein
VWHDVDDQQVVRLLNRDDLKAQPAVIGPDPQQARAVHRIGFDHLRYDGVHHVQGVRPAHAMLAR